MVDLFGFLIVMKKCGDIVIFDVGYVMGFMGIVILGFMLCWNGDG